MPRFPLLPALALLAAWPAAAQMAADPPKPVQVALYLPAPTEAQTQLTGVVRPRHEADIGFRAGGRITQRLVNLGESVVAGQPLAQLDPGDLGLALRSAEADLAAARAQSIQATNDANRSAQLVGGGHISAAVDDQRQAAARAAREKLASAEAALALARNRLGYATLLAPQAGVVTAVLAEAGQVVAEGTPVLRLANPTEREVLVQVPEALLARLAGPETTASFWARPGETLPVRLRETAAQADAGLRTYAVRFSLPEAPDWVRLGMTATVRLAARGPEAATVPLSALHDRGQGPMLWALAGEDRLRAVPVQVLALAEATATVTAALPEGARIVALGPQLLAPDTRVRVVSTRLAGSLR